MSVRFNTIEIHKVWLPFVSPQPAWQGTLVGRDVVLLRAEGPDGVAWSELAAMPDPTYVSEFLDAELMVLIRYLIPGSIGVTWDRPEDYFDWLDRQVIGHGFAKGALDFLGWSLHALSQNAGLISELKTERTTVRSGLVLGLNDWSESCLSWVVASGYNRVKFKVSSDTPIHMLSQIRSELPPNCLMSIDGNGRLNLDMLNRLTFLDWVEEPLTPGDWAGYRRATQQVSVPIVLDESIQSPLDAMTAVQLGCAAGIVLKPARLGGITPTRRLVPRLAEAGIRVGIGGMYETGVGRFYNLVLDATIQDPLVGDFSPDSRYWQVQLLTTPHVLTNGVFQLADIVPTVDRSILDQNGDTLVARFS